MTRHEAKDTMQKKALNSWFRRGCKGVLQLATGAGKTYAAIKAIKWVMGQKSDAKILIIVPTTVIRDDVFPDEFKKWNFEEALDKVTIECIQTVYKWKDKHFDLIIGDEWHNYIPEEDDYDSKLYEYHKFFENNTYDRLLGLTAWIPEKKRKISRKIVPVAYTLTTDDAVELGIISPYVEFNMPIEMDKEELTAYNKIQGNYRRLENKLGGYIAFSRAGQYMKDIGKIKPNDRTSQEKEQIGDASMFWKIMQKRKKFLYECPSKVKIVHQVIDELNLSGSVIFSQATIFADLICVGRNDILPFHSKLKKKDSFLTAFKNNNNGFNHLSTCIAVNEGMDIPKLPNIIIASRTSGAKAHIQRRGRCLRFQEGKTSYVFNLYLPGTQDEKWLRSSQKTTNANRIKWVKNLNETKEIIKLLELKK
jgi:superfamily II DNA or RNA helicase